MSDGIKAWHEDSDDYVRLCEKYDEAVKDEINSVRGWPWNSKHHAELKRREQQERQNEYDRVFKEEYGKNQSELTQEERQSMRVLMAHERTIARLPRN